MGRCNEERETRNDVIILSKEIRLKLGKLIFDIFIIFLRNIF